MSELNFLMKVDDIDELVLGGSGGERPFTVIAQVGRNTKQLFGLKVIYDGKTKNIWFGDIEKLDQIAEAMMGKK